MADAKYRFCLTDDKKRELNQMVSSGMRNARQVLDALILLIVLDINNIMCYITIPKH